VWIHCVTLTKESNKVMRTTFIILSIILLSSCSKEEPRCVDCETIRQVYINPEPNGTYLWVDTFVIGESCYCGEDYQYYINQNEDTYGNTLERFVTKCKLK
jgi:hypothetical protein